MMCVLSEFSPEMATSTFSESGEYKNLQELMRLKSSREESIL